MGGSGTRVMVMGGSGTRVMIMGGQWHTCHGYGGQWHKCHGFMLLTIKPDVFMPKLLSVINKKENNTAMYQSVMITLVFVNGNFFAFSKKNRRLNFSGMGNSCTNEIQIFSDCFLGIVTFGRHLPMRTVHFLQRKTRN